MVPGKDVAQVRKHYELLVEDVNCIEAGWIELPDYNSPIDRSGMVNDMPSVKKSAAVNPAQESNKASAKPSEQDRKKGIPWTEDEHRLFLLGLDKFGKGDWRSISRNFVVSRTPTQVASHAQKYFIRLNSINKEKRRSSIHDITSVNNCDSTYNQAGGQSSRPITGQTSPPSSSSSAPLCSSPQAPPHPRPPIYIPPPPPALGQPIAAPMAAPVLPPYPLKPPPHLIHPFISASPLPFSSSPPLPRTTHFAFPMPQSALHQ